MARYPKRQKVKRYRRSFYTREMRLKKGIGIAVLVVAVLAAAWVAAPHVLDWATHTWYTVVRNRDLSASSETTASSAAASSEVTAEPAASSEVRADSEPGSEPAAPAGVIIEGSWGVLDTAAAKDEASLRAAARQLAQQVAEGTLKPEDITEEMMSDHMYTAGQKDPDFILRPSGEKRLSNFMLWQAAYAELVEMDVLWPDFTRDDLDAAIMEFNRRSRRFGGL